MVGVGEIIHSDFYKRRKLFKNRRLILFTLNIITMKVLNFIPFLSVWVQWHRRSPADTSEAEVTCRYVQGSNLNKRPARKVKVLQDKQRKK
jgi:hypothetical protein